MQQRKKVRLREQFEDRLQCPFSTAHARQPVVHQRDA
jgi:hypothetical protein